MNHLRAAFADELTKLAKKKWDPQTERQRAVLTELAGTGGILGTGLLAPLFLRGRGTESPIDLNRRAAQVAREMGLPSDLHVRTGKKPRLLGFKTLGKKILGPLLELSPKQREAVIAHEMGHFKGQLTYPESLKKLIAMSSNLWKMPGVRLGGYGAAGMLSTVLPTPSYLPAAAVAAMSAPLLAEEATASGRALKHMAKKHGLMKGVAKSLPLLPAFATYALPVALPYLITRSRKKYRKETGAGEEDRIKMGPKEILEGSVGIVG
jgi:hypothetical protein